MNHWMGFSRTAVAAAVAIVAAAPAFAQNTTAAVSGRVVDGNGQPVAGANVTIVHLESGSTNNAVTDAQGRYAARGLRAGGPYTITISKDGQTDKREDLFLNLAETFSLDAQLGSATQTIVVTGRGVGGVDRSKMGAGTSLGSRELNAYASVSRNLQDYARTDPRLAQTDKGNGSISAAGQNNRFNSITVDGVTTSDTFGLEANNLPTKKQPISIDAIQAVQVNLSNYDVTQKGYTGANINAVTKSGTNDFRGSVYYVTRDDDLVGKSYNRATDTYTDFAPFKESTKGFTLGGPIIPDTLFFFGGYEEFKSSKARPNFGPLGSSLANVGISQTAIDQAIAISRNTWSFDAGSATVPGSLELVVKDTLFKLDWNISDQHRANLRYSKTEQSDPVITTLFGPTQLSLSSYWYVTDKTIETLVGQWFADWTPTFSTELKLSQRDYKQRHTPVSGSRLPAVRLTFAGTPPTGVTGGNRTLDFGTEISRQFNVLDTETLDIYAGATWNLGAHELKFGLDYADNKIFNAFLQNANGNYNFQCENSSATYTYTSGPITCATATAAAIETAVLENYQRGRFSSYTGQQPASAGLTLQDAAARFSIANTGLFLQDNWRLNSGLSLMFGVRVDQQNVPDKPLFNASAAAAPVAGVAVGGVPTTRATGGFGIDNSVTLDGNTLVQPRVGFNWNLGSPNGRSMQLRGGVGLFQGAAATVWLSNPYSNTGVAVRQVSCASASLCNGVQFSTNPDSQPSPASTPPAAVVDAISPNLEQPSVWKANLAFETELPALPVVGTLVAGAEWLHTKTHSAIFYQHLNLGAPTATGNDGRDLFYRREGYDPSCYAVGANGSVSNLTAGACATPGGQSRTRALSNASFGNVILANKTTKGYGDAITLTLNKPLSQGWGYGIGYTRTTAKEVSPLTSSTSNSTWNGRNVFNPNEEVLQNSNYAIKDRFTANLIWQKAFFGNYSTSVGLFYEGRKGKPYSWTYINDLNGDGISGNDLMYIPSAPGSGEVIFKGGAAEEARFWDVVNANGALSAAKGGVVGRNNSHAPWVNNVDMRFSQQLPGLWKNHKATFQLDILNVGNLLNKKWGHIDEIDFPSRRQFVSYAGRDTTTGKYIYSLAPSPNSDFLTRQNERESQWAVQATLRYEF